MTNVAYTLPRDRDAFSTIRGYVYQVDTTLKRWLDLRVDQHLELERGEDIDLINRAINASSALEASRLLEQVKHREQNLTLRNPAALESLAKLSSFTNGCFSLYLSGSASPVSSDSLATTFNSNFQSPRYQPPIMPLWIA